ncbi:MAG: 3-methyl-2-oxobutanoate hydroxymethyltransferase [Lentisphaerae bacterium]|nr:3-methyl-2-oxobutanoate hydroxymethyltransferase [Lentisphaerota bacterium]
MKKVTVSAFAKRKAAGEKIVMCTAYDAPFAKAALDAGIDMMLVGDSVGTTHLGYSSTLPVTMEDMIRHTQAARRGAPEAFLVGDMPFMSYQTCIEDGIRNAGRLIKEAGADAVKLEGGAEYAELTRRLVKSGIPVMGHIGLMPQSFQVLGGYKVQGRGDDGVAGLIADAKALESAGAFAIVLECVPEMAAKAVTEALSVPTVGIGCGRYCSGQIQVLHDLLGLLDFQPKHAGRYAEVGAIAREALKQYCEDVKAGTFPAEQNIFHD